MTFLDGKTYFGLTVVSHGQAAFVREADIQRLSFHESWMESAMGSTILEIGGVDLVPLSDWESFCRRYISTGTHRFQG